MVLAIRLNFDYSPREAIEIPVEVAEEYVGKNGKVGWTLALANDARVLRIPGSDLLNLAPANHLGGEPVDTATSEAEASRLRRAGAAASIRLIGPEIEVIEEDGTRRSVRPLDEGYSQLYARLPEDEQDWHPSWGFHPDDDPNSYPPDAVF